MSMNKTYAISSEGVWPGRGYSRPLVAQYASQLCPEHHGRNETGFGRNLRSHERPSQLLGIFCWRVEGKT